MPTRFQTNLDYGTRGQQVPTLPAFRLPHSTKYTGRDLCKISIFGTFLRNALLERLKIFQYSLRMMRCYF